MLIELTSNDFAEKGSFALVLACYRYDQEVEYFCYSKAFQSHPHICKSADIKIIDSEQPTGWVEIAHSQDGAKYSISSFPDWAKEPLFLNWLMEDDWMPEKTSKASEIIKQKFQSSINFYATKKCGSLHKAKEKIVKLNFDSKTKEYKYRGFERSTPLDLSESALANFELTLDNLKKIYKLTSSPS